MCARNAIHYNTRNPSMIFYCVLVVLVNDDNNDDDDDEADVDDNELNRK